MVCKMLFFDCNDKEKLFFDKNDIKIFEVKTFKTSLNKKNVKDLSPDDIEQAAALSVFTPSLLSEEVINYFPNLRVIATRSKDYKNINLKSCLNRNIAVVSVESENNEFQTLHTLFKSVTDALCGCKENRIV